ncbi:MAG: MATE family efflux transporter [Anaerovoracaceae bacterium]
METNRNSFFTKDKAFYMVLFPMLITVAMQNLIAYSVNMADNIMLGSYSQDALSGASTVNQIFFLVQQFAISIGNTLVALASQYWGQQRIKPIRTLTGIALKLGTVVSMVLIVLCELIPEPILRIFTPEASIISQGKAYLVIIAWSFLLFVITQTLMAALRAVETVGISFYVSVVSLIINVVINYLLIFGKFGFPELGIVGAAIGTLLTRGIELAIVLVYLAKFDTKLQLLCKELFLRDALLSKDYCHVYIPIMCSSVLWGVSVPMQTAILGHLSANAIAANSVATTFYQYLKVIVVAMSSTSAVMIGTAIGRGDMERIKSDARTLSCIDIVIGLILGISLVVLRVPLLSLYDLNDDAIIMASNLIGIMGVIMVGMSYQMPVSFGIFQGGGDGTFTMKMNLISTWCIVMPLSFMAAFWWKLPVEWVVVVIQSDQIFKCLPTFIHFRKYKWMKKLTRPNI